MDESLKTGIGLTGFVCAAGYIMCGITALFPCIVFCGFLWVYEIQERISRSSLQVKKCEHCGCKVRITDKKSEWEHNTIGLYFQYPRSYILAWKEPLFFLYKNIYLKGRIFNIFVI